MKRFLAVLRVTSGLVLLVGASAAWADGDDAKSDFALFNGSAPANASPNTGAVCGAKKADRAFVYHVTATNRGAAGAIRVRYRDGDAVDYAIPAGGSFSFSQAGGSKGAAGADQVVRVCGVGGALLDGSMSAIGEREKVFCVSCDVVTTGGVGNTACNAIVPVPGPIGPFTCP